MSDKANVRICSNVFPVTTAREYDFFGKTRYHGVCNDARFLKQIRGKPALKKLAVTRFGDAIHEGSLRDSLLESNLVEGWQIKVFWDSQGSGGCVDCPVGARPFGIVRRNDNYAVENRCEKSGCRSR